MTGTVRASTVKVTTNGVRFDRGFEIRDLALRTAATEALGRGQFVDDWLTALVLASVAADPAGASRFDTSGNGLGADVC
jgi:hypothetical protein